MGSKRCAVTPGKPFEIELSRRVRLEAVLRYRPRTFAGHGIAFEHPSDMTVVTTETGPHVGFEVGPSETPRVSILSSPQGQKTPEEALADVVRNFKALMESMFETSVTEAPVKRVIAGVERTGVRLTGVDRDDPPCNDVYVLMLGERRIGIVFRSFRSTRDEAERSFQMIGGTLALARDDEPRPEPGPAFELRVGDRVYAIDLDRSFQIEDARGRRHEAVLVRGRKEYDRFGMRFSYPGDATVSAEQLTGRVRITVEHGADYFASFQIFSTPGIPVEQARDVSVKSVRSAVEHRTGRRFGPVQVCRRTFLGHASEGTRITTLGAEDPVHVEIHGIVVGERTVAVLFYWVESARTVAEGAIEQIASTLGEGD